LCHNSLFLFFAAIVFLVRFWPVDKLKRALQFDISSGFAILVLTYMAKTEVAQKLRLRIKSYDHKLIDNSARQIIEAAERNDAKVNGPIPLPTEIKRYTVNRSTFIDKDSREQFELRVHKRLVEISNPSQKIIESLSNLNLPAGVDIEIKMV
jgi:small subunit ribosomal protein S10